MEKDLDITSPEGLKAAVADVQLHGDPNFWICVSKASSKEKGWMHSTKVALVIGRGLLIQTSTEIKNPQGRSTSSQAITFIPEVRLIGRTVRDKIHYEFSTGRHIAGAPWGCFVLDDVVQPYFGSEDQYGKQA